MQGQEALNALNAPSLVCDGEKKKNILGPDGPPSISADSHPRRLHTTCEEDICGDYFSPTGHHTQADTLH